MQPTDPVGQAKFEGRVKHVKLSCKLAAALRVAAAMALGAALVPLLASSAEAGGTITQIAPQANASTVSSAASSGFNDQLETTGSSGTLAFTQLTGSASLTVSTTGAVSTTGTLSAGAYTATGTDSDTSADSGTWTYTLTVGAIVQSTPTANGTPYSPATSQSFTDQLRTNDGETVTYDQTGGSPDLTVTTSGAVSVTTGDSPLVVGDYTVTGTDSDSDLDTGTWSYTLDVTSSTLVTTPSANGSTVTPATSHSFTDLLLTTGNDGPVTYDQTGARRTSPSRHRERSL